MADLEGALGNPPNDALPEDARCPAVPHSNPDAQPCDAGVVSPGLRLRPRHCAAKGGAASFLSAAEPQSLVEAARDWAQLGFTPMAVCDKKPLARSWQTLNADDHLAWIDAKPAEQIGVRMGRQGDGRILIAVDVDGPEGAQSLATLERELGALPSTMEQLTGGGGRHLVYEWPTTHASECPTVSASKLGAKLDIRGERGHIVAAPSAHRSGRRYELVDARAPTVLPLPWVERIVDTHRPPTRATNAAEPEPATTEDVVERCRRYVARMPEAISGSGGHAATFRVAQVAVRRFRLEPPTALAVMREYNGRCKPPWSDQELRHKIDSARRHGRMPQGRVLERDIPWRTD